MQTGWWRRAPYALQIPAALQRRISTLLLPPRATLLLCNAAFAAPPVLASRFPRFASRASVSAVRGLSTTASQLGSVEEIEEVRAWRSSFTRDSIPHRSFDIRHARSSGAGGQNVNKVNTKVDLRFTLRSAAWLPALVRRVLEVTERGRVNSKGEFIMTSERHRTQLENLSDCVDKIFECCCRAAQLDGESSPETRRRIEKLYAAQQSSSTHSSAALPAASQSLSCCLHLLSQRLQQQRRLVDKSHQRVKKAARRSRDGD